MTPRIQHPWEIFLAARANAIDWLRKEFGDKDAEIAQKLSMDTMQVYLIRTRDRSFDHTGAADQPSVALDDDRFMVTEASINNGLPVALDGNHQGVRHIGSLYGQDDDWRVYAIPIRTPDPTTEVQK